MLMTEGLEKTIKDRAWDLALSVQQQAVNRGAKPSAGWREKLAQEIESQVRVLIAEEMGQPDLAGEIARLTEERDRLAMRVRKLEKAVHDAITFLEEDR